MSGETHGREPSVLLATKLHVSALRDRLIGRAWLVQGLSAGNVRKLTLVSAPAGWGKTTLHAQRVDSEKEHVRFAWLSLDRADNDPVRFWTYVVAALRRAQPAVAMRASDLLARDADLEESVLPTLLNELADLDAGSVLILDDYHLVTNPWFISRWPSLSTECPQPFMWCWPPAPTRPCRWHGCERAATCGSCVPCSAVRIHRGKSPG